MKMTMIETRERIRRKQAEWAQARRDAKVTKIASFDVVSLATGQTVAHADDPEHVVELASDYRQDPDLSFVAIDEDGREAGIWSIGEVLNGTFETELSV